MSEDAKPMTCAEFQELLPELVGSGENLEHHPHLEHCELCRALLADLQTIADAARQLFPVADPPEHLWEHIELAIKSDAHPAEGEEEKGEATTGDGNLSAEPA